MVELAKAVEGIFSVRKRIEGAWDNPSALSDLGNKMAAYQSYLGDHLGEFKKERETKKATYYLKYLDEASATAADNLSRAKVAELTGQVKKLELLHSDTRDQVSMIQSRLKVMADEQRNLS